MTISLFSRSSSQQGPSVGTVWFWQKRKSSASQMDRVSDQKTRAVVGGRRSLDLRAVPENLVMRDLLGL